jgi:putative ABC transport system permease protein
VLTVDPDLPVFNIRTIDELVGDSLGRPRFTTTLLSLFAGLALILAAIGIYGVLSFTMGQKTREVSIRMALGAQRRQVIGLVVREGMTPVFAGGAAGLACALVVSHFLSSQVYGVSTSDPLTFACVAVVLSLVALAAVLKPAFRATRIEATSALRYE